MAQTLESQHQELVQKFEKAVADRDAKFELAGQIFNERTDPSLLESKKDQLRKKHEKVVSQHQKLAQKVDDLKRKIQQLEVKIKLQRALMKKAEIDIEIRDIQLEAMDVEDNDFSEDQMQQYIMHARRVQRSQDALSVLRDPLNESRDWLRSFVTANPTGWLDNPDPSKRYRFVRVGKTMVILQDGVSYEISLDDLLNHVRAPFDREDILKYLHQLGILKIDNTALVKAIESEELDFMDVKAHSMRTMTIEDWEAIRDRKLKAPTVVVREEDAVGDEKVVVIKPELLSLPIDKLPENTNLNLSHVNPLLDSGLQIVGQLRGMATVDLIDIKGIGQVRAAEILDEVTNKLG